MSLNIEYQAERDSYEISDNKHYDISGDLSDTVEIRRVPDLSGFVIIVSHNLSSFQDNESEIDERIEL